MIKNFSNEPIKLDSSKKSIFLAGPTKRNSSFENSWRKEACDYLKSRDFDGIVYIPEFSKGSNYDYLTQVNWEKQGLVNSSKILFYIPRKFPEMPGLTTNVEYGMYLAKRPNDIIFCSPKDAEKNRYLEWLYLEEVPNGIIYSTLEEALESFLN